MKDRVAMNTCVKTFLAAIVLALSALTGALRPAEAAMPCRMQFPMPSDSSALKEVGEEACPEQLLSLLFSRMPAQAPSVSVVSFSPFKDRTGQSGAFVAFRMVAAEGQGYGPDRRICPEATNASDMQVIFTWFAEDRSWSDLDSRGGYTPDTICTGGPFWSDQEVADTISPVRLSRLSETERKGVHNVAKGDPERKAILDAVRRANADISSRVAVVFVVDTLRSDGKHAYFAGKARQKSDGRPLSAEVWGPCEQDPEDGVIEALLVKKNGGWSAIKSNRCADDVFLTEEDRRNYRLLIADE